MCVTIVPLNVDDLKALVETEFSEEGSNQRYAEEQAWINFVDFLDECEGKICWRQLLIIHQFKCFGYINILKEVQIVKWKMS